MAGLLPPDLEAWLCGFVRDVVLPGAGLDAAVSNKEPADGVFPAALVVIRDDSGPRASIVTQTRSVGVSVLAGTRLLDAPAIDLARPVFAALTDEALPVVGGRSCPIAAVTGFYGPYRVAEPQDRTRVYFTAEYAVVGLPAG